MLTQRRFAMAVGLLLLGGVLLRARVALDAPWYWDEGYVVELARSLAAGGRPQVGGLWHDGFFPLSTSWIAPWSAAPLVSLPFWSPMTGARAWAVLWEGACILLLALIGRRWGGPRLGLLAAGAYAVLPYAVFHGGRAFYHHLAAAFLLLGVWLGQRAFEDGRRRSAVAAGLAMGVGVATCYWLWWLPASWLALLAWRRFHALPTAALAASVLPAWMLLWQSWPDLAGARWSVISLLQTTVAEAPPGASALFKALGLNLSALSFLALGLGGLAVAAWRSPDRWAWPALLLLFAVLEPARQRGAIVGMPYPYILAAPLAALGVAWALSGLLALARPWTWGLSALLALAWLRPHPVGNVEAWSFKPEKVAELKAFLDSRPPGATVCGLPHFNWAMRPALRVCEPFDVGASEGRASGFYAPSAPASRFAHPCGVDELHYAVLSRVHPLGAFRNEGVALSFFEMERQGWPKVFDNRTFRVHANPRFGAPRDNQARLLSAPEDYAFAADQARRAGRPQAEREARARSTANP